MLVIIPSAGIGSRLDLHTKYFNKSMIQLGDTPVIGKIIESYPNNTKFIISIGYKGDHIEEYLKLAYPNKNIRIKKVKLFSGPSSGLTHTLRQSLSLINEPFFFHANDTIFGDKKFYSNVKKDTMFLSKKDCDTMKYATVEVKNNKIKIHNKLNYLRKDYFNYTGVGYISNFRLFKKLIREDKNNNGELSYFKSINPKEIEFRYIKNWFDIGSKETKENAEIYFSKKSILPKYDQGIFFKKDKVLKFFTNPQLIKKRYDRSKILYPYVPKIIYKKKYFYIYRYVKGKIFSQVQNKEKSFLRLLIWLNKKFWKKINLNDKQYYNFSQRCNNFYYEKSLSRINYLYEKNNLKDEREIINNVKVKKISEIFKQIDWLKLNSGLAVNFHGDLHFENIIKTKKNFILLDWREDFDGLKDYGDIYYDLAKLNHGLIIDHSMIKNFNFNVFKQKDMVKIKFFQSKENQNCQKILFNFIKKEKLSILKVKILTALIFLNIAGLHHYPYSIFLYYLGKLYLHKSIKNSKVK